MEKFIDLLKEALDREDTIELTDEFRDYDEWNSIAYMSTIAMLNEEYGVQLTLDEFKKLKTVKDIYDVTLLKS